jgi:hypothetical protein
VAAAQQLMKREAIKNTKNIDKESAKEYRGIFR